MNAEPAINVRRPLRVTLILALTDIEVSRFDKLMEGYGGLDLAAYPARMSEAIYRSLEAVLPGDNVRARFSGEVVAIVRCDGPPAQRWERVQTEADA